MSLAQRLWAAWVTQMWMFALGYPVRHLPSKAVYHSGSLNVHIGFYHSFPKLCKLIKTCYLSIYMFHVQCFGLMRSGELLYAVQRTIPNHLPELKHIRAYSNMYRLNALKTDLKILIMKTTKCQQNAKLCRGSKTIDNAVSSFGLGKQALMPR